MKLYAPAMLVEIEGDPAYLRLAVYFRGAAVFARTTDRSGGKRKRRKYSEGESYPCREVEVRALVDAVVHVVGARGVGENLLYHIVPRATSNRLGQRKRHAP